MTREKKPLEIDRKHEYPASFGARMLSSTSMALEECLGDIRKQMKTMPGRAEEKYVVFLHCSDNSLHAYPIYECSEGFTAAMQCAIEEHQRLTLAVIDGGLVHGIDDSVYEPPDYLVQMMALGANVLVTNRLQNRPTKASDLRGNLGQGGGTN